MKISEQFTDYGLIGGFFWMLLLSIWVGYGFPTIPWDTLISEFRNDLTSVPAPALTAVTALLGAFAIIVIFTTGLLIF